MKFPVQRGKSKAGLEVEPGQCPICRGLLNAEPGSFAFINGGALRRVDKQAAVPDAYLLGFLSVGFHGAHGQVEQAASASIHIAENVPIGQFEFYFCSTQCMREFFNECVNEVERKLSEQRGG
jgi:hypothetical protein